MRILVVDDYPPKLERIKSLINELGDGFEIFEATDGIEGLKVFEECNPDVVVTDLYMGRVTRHEDGFSLIRAIRAIQPDDRIPIIAYSSGDGKYHNRSLEAGADVFVRPNEEDKMRAVLKIYLR